MWSNAVFVSAFEKCAELDGHSGCVNCLSWSADGRMLLSGSDDRTVRIWHAANGVPRRGSTLRSTSIATDHRHNIFVVKFAPNCSGSRIVSACGAGAVMVHDVEFGSDTPGRSKSWLAFQEPERNMILSIAFAPFDPNMMFIARTGAQGALALCDLRSPGVDVNDALAMSTTRRSLTSIAFHPRREYEFALASEGNTVLVYDARKRDPLRSFAPWRADTVASGVACVAFSQRGIGQRTELLANYRGYPLCIFDADARVAEKADTESGSPSLGSGSLQPWDASHPITSAPLMEYQGRNNVTTFAKQAAFWGDDDAFVLTGGDCGSIFAWEKRTGQLVWQASGDRDVVNCVAPHPAGLPLFAVSGIDSSVKLLSVDRDWSNSSDGDDVRRRSPHWSQMRDAARCARYGMTGAVDHAAFRETHPAPCGAASAFDAARAATCLRLAEEARAQGATMFAHADQLHGALFAFAQGAALCRGMEPGSMEFASASLSGMLRTDFAQSEDNTLHIFRSFPEEERRRVQLLSKCELNMAAVLVRLGASPRQSDASPHNIVEQWSAVRVLCSRVLARDPRSVKALYRRARAFGATNTILSCTAAIHDLKQALAVDPSCAAVAKLLRVMVQRKKEAKKRLASNLREALAGSSSSGSRSCSTSCAPADDDNVDSNDT